MDCGRRGEDSKEYVDHEDVRKDGGIEQRIQAVKELWAMYGGKSLSTLSDVGHRISTTTAHLPVGSTWIGRTERACCRTAWREEARSHPRGRKEDGVNWAGLGFRFPQLIPVNPLDPKTVLGPGAASTAQIQAPALGAPAFAYTRTLLAFIDWAVEAAGLALSGCVVKKQLVDCSLYWRGWTTSLARRLDPRAAPVSVSTRLERPSSGSAFNFPYPFLVPLPFSSRSRVHIRRHPKHRWRALPVLLGGQEAMTHPQALSAK
ncbi:hypothetical protein C8R47DRAFT_1194015 [Mycena vitilis]|nr:hypothetical protein C8R47DRAFT_1194015 [Mycena vitilis]